MRRRSLGASFPLAVAGLLAVAPAQPAAATAVTLEADVDPAAIVTGTVFTVVVGLDDVDEIRGYLLGIAWGDRLALVDAEAIACRRIGPSVCEQEPFTVDPLAEVTEDGTTQAAVLVTPPLVLALDGSTTDPIPDSRRGLFALTFEALEEGPSEVTSGAFDPLDEGVAGIDTLVLLDPATTTLAFEIVPEPGAASGLAAAALALVALGRARR